jgi:hypothetical protein
MTKHKGCDGEITNQKKLLNDQVKKFTDGEITKHKKLQMEK